MKIKCPLCGFENEEGSKFCANCEEPLPTYVRRWDINREEEIKHLQICKVIPEILFASMMHGLCCFAMDDPRRKKIPEFQKAGLDICKNFGNDASLFEVGCYLYFRLDLWLFLNRPDLKGLISKNFAKEFVKLFTFALRTDNVVVLFNERVSRYGDIALKEEGWLKKTHSILSRLVAKTKDNNLPKNYKFEEVPLNLNTIEDFLIETELISWEKEIVPILLNNNLKKYCDLLEE